MANENAIKEVSTEVNYLDRLAKMAKEREEKSANRGTGGYTKMFHSWKPGANNIRLVGRFIEVRTHYLGQENQKVALCKKDAFDKANPRHIPMIVNCPNWNKETNEFVKDGKCPICALNKLARVSIKHKDDPEMALKPSELADFEALKSATSSRSSLKWSIIDRDNPNVIKVENGTETQVPGYKIATITNDIQKGILTIGSQLGDISSINSGVDITVTQSKVNNKTSYTVSPSFDPKTRQVKVTPLTAEERGMQLPDLDAMCAKQTEIKDIYDALTDEFRQLIEDNQDVSEAIPSAPTTSSATASTAVVEPGDDDIPF